VPALPPAPGGRRERVQLAAIDGEQDATLAELGDLTVVRVDVPAGERERVDDESLEDPARRIGHDLVDDADAAAAAIEDRHALGDREV
jgi:hypothetical protein